LGKPEVLQEGATRAKDANPEYGNVSEFSMTLKTSYEQKFIGDIDPGSAMLDIIRNLTRMGTSDMIFFADKNADIFKEIRNATQQGTSVNAWWEVIVKLVDGFIRAMLQLMTSLKNTMMKPTNSSDTESTESTQSVSTNSIISGVSTIIKNAGKSILASTIAKWKWPLVGGMGVMTGENTTPWHLTLGNPKSPFVSLGNIKIEKVIINFKNELGFNDMPTKMDVTININLGRQIGAQEIFAMFNNGYSRVYDTIDSQYMSLNKLYKTSSGIKENSKVSSVKDKDLKKTSEMGHIYDPDDFKKNN
jgi:hypothetical protein